MTLSFRDASLGSGNADCATLEGPVRRTVSGRLDLAFECDADGRTYLGAQYACHPFHVCRAHYHDSELPGLATLYVQSCSGGLYEHDSLDITLKAAPGAHAHVSTQAATVVHSMPEGRADQRAIIVSQPGAYLEYLPDPQVLFPRSRCRSSIDVTIAEGAVAMVSDAFLAHDPEGEGGSFDHYASEIVIRSAAREVLAIDRLLISGGAAARSPAGIFGHFGAQGTLIVACPGLIAVALVTRLQSLQFDYTETAIGASLLPKSAGVIVRVLAADGAALKHGMHVAWCAARMVLKGTEPAERRK